MNLALYEPSYKLHNPFSILYMYNFEKIYIEKYIII